MRFPDVLNYQPTFVPWTSLKTSGVNQSQSNPIYACFLGRANPIYVCCFGRVNPNPTRFMHIFSIGPIPIQPDLCILFWLGQPDLCVLFRLGQP